MVTFTISFDHIAFECDYLYVVVAFLSARQNSVCESFAEDLFSI